MARNSWLSRVLVFWLGRPWKAAQFFSVARKATLLWPGLPQNPGLDRAYQALPGDAFLASGAKNIASLAWPGLPCFWPCSWCKGSLLMGSEAPCCHGGLSGIYLLIYLFTLYFNFQQPLNTILWIPIFQNLRHPPLIFIRSLKTFKTLSKNCPKNHWTKDSKLTAWIISWLNEILARYLRKRARLK